MCTKFGAILNFVLKICLRDLVELPHIYFYQQIIRDQEKHQSDNPYSIQLRNVEYYQTVVRRISKNILFFPASKPTIFDFDCDSNNTEDTTKSKICHFQSTSSQVKYADVISCQITSINFFFCMYIYSFLKIGNYEKIS